MIVLGVDPGSMRTGYGAVETDGRRHRLVEMGALVPGLADPVEGAERDGHAVADASHVDDRLLRLLADEAAPDLRDHEGTPSAGRRQAKQRATARASVASPGSAAWGSSSIRVTM